jgi:dynein heavy chain
MEREVDKDKVVVIDPQTDNFMLTIERSISTGNVVVLQDIDEELDPAIEPVLTK